MKRCSRCAEVKELSEFYRQQDRAFGVRSACKACCAPVASRYNKRPEIKDQANKRRREERPDSQDRLRAIARRSYFANRQTRLDGIRARKYGLSAADYAAMASAQSFACAICRLQDRRALSVDHDHSTGAIRGLLCSGCNTGLGLLGDDPERLNAAAAYLRSAAARKAAAS